MEIFNLNPLEGLESLDHSSPTPYLGEVGLTKPSYECYRL